jgi:PD-(D/E)XK endonuclease
VKTATRGNAAEAQILAAFVLRGFACKTAWLIARGCLAFHCRSTDHGRRRQPYLGLADLFAVYLPADDTVYLIPVGLIPGHLGRLRLEPTKNNQQRGVRFAMEFEIDRWSREKLRSLTA